MAVLPQTKVQLFTLSADGQIFSPPHTDSSKHILNIILFKNRLVV